MPVDPVSALTIAVSAPTGPATMTVYDRPASRASGRVTSAVSDPEALIRPVAGPGSSTAGGETSVRATACATVFPFTSRSSVPASGDALASRTRAVSAASGPTGSGLQAASGSAVAMTAMIAKRMRLGLRHLG